MKNFLLSLVDVILTNQSRFCFNTFNFGCGVSDYHNMTGVLVKGTAPRVEKHEITYGNFKNFSEKEFDDDVSRVPFMLPMSLMVLMVFTGRMSDSRMISSMSIARNTSKPRIKRLYQW